METLKIRTGGIDSQNKILMPLDDFQMHEDFSLAQIGFLNGTKGTRSEGA